MDERGGVEAATRSGGKQRARAMSAVKINTPRLRWLIGYFKKDNFTLAVRAMAVVYSCV
jgi:hypothetical protein